MLDGGKKKIFNAMFCIKSAVVAIFEQLFEASSETGIAIL